MGLPPQPWTLAADDPPDVVTVTEFKGGWEPERRCVFYGLPDPGHKETRIVRSPALRMRVFHDVVLTPHHIVFSQSDGKLLPLTYGLGHHLDWLIPGTADPTAPQRYNAGHCTQPPVEVQDPVFFAEPVWDEYGHVLLEAVPKLAMLRGAPKGIQVVSSGKSFQPFFRAFDVDGERLRIFRGPLHCRTVYVPDPPVDITGNFHIGARAAFARLAHFMGPVDVATMPRVFLSRSRMKVRRLTNEREIEALFERYGFVVINPELIPVGRQIKLLANAEMVAGLGGSAMHNMVFAPASTKALIVSSERWVVNIDRFIAKADGQYGFVLGEATPNDRPEREWPWTVDLHLVEHAIHEHFGL